MPSSMAMLTGEKELLLIKSTKLTSTHCEIKAETDTTSDANEATVWYDEGDDAYYLEILVRRTGEATAKVIIGPEHWNFEPFELEKFKFFKDKMGFVKVTVLFKKVGKPDAKASATSKPGSVEKSDAKPSKASASGPVKA